MLTNRSTEKELLDLGPNYYSSEEYIHCQKILFRINKLFGFFKSTVKVLKHFSKQSSLLDMGCGGGLFLLHLSQYFPDMTLHGTDISAEAIEIAQQELMSWQRNNPKLKNVSFSLQANNNFQFPKNNIDIIITTMVCHHLTDNEIISFLKSSLKSVRQIVVINDLHRHVIPQFFYRLFSPILFRNRLITHDGLISIRRGFTKAEWRTLLHEAAITHYQIKWCFPFRWQVLLWKK